MSEFIALAPPREVVPFLLLSLAAACGVFLWITAIDEQVSTRKSWRWGDAPRRAIKGELPSWFTPWGLSTGFAVIILAGFCGAFSN